MARQKHAKQSLVEALTSILRHARTSLYQPFVAPSEHPVPSASPVADTVNPATNLSAKIPAKIIAFPQSNPSAVLSPNPPRPAAATPFPSHARNLSTSFKI